MITKIFNAKIYYNKIIIKLQKKIQNIYKKHNIFPLLAIIIINNNFSTNLYIKNKIKICIKTNIQTIIFKFSKNIKNKTIKIIIKLINLDKTINAIIIQLPLYKNIKNLIFNYISVNKDIDMLNPKTFGSYILNYKKKFHSCTSKAIIKMLNLKKIKIKATKVIIFGFSNIVGKPLMFDLFSKGATVTVINKKDKKINTIIKHADIIIIAVGHIDFIKKQKIPYGTIIIDVGINNLNNKKIIGDVNITNYINHIKYLTAVPGGIGTITLIKIIKNIITTLIFKNRNI